jgi:hypothetical protein
MTREPSNRTRDYELEGRFLSSIFVDFTKTKCSTSLFNQAMHKIEVRIMIRQFVAF